MSIKNYIHNINFYGADNTLLDCPDVSYKYNADTYDITKLFLIIISTILLIISVIVIVFCKNGSVQTIASAVLGGVISTIIWVITAWHTDKTNSELSKIEQRLYTVDKLLNSVNSTTNIVNPVTLEIKKASENDFKFRLLKYVQMLENLKSQKEIDSSRFTVKWFDGRECSVNKFLESFEEMMNVHTQIIISPENINVLNYNEHMLATNLQQLKDKLQRQRLYVICGDAPASKSNLKNRIRLKNFFEMFNRNENND